MKRWPINKAWFWETAPFFRLLLPLVAGIVVYDRHWLTGVSINAVLSVLVIYLLGHGLLLIFRKPFQAASYLSFIFLHTVVFLSGWTLSYYGDVRNDALWFGHSLNKADAWQARITKVPLEKERTWKLEVDVLNGIKEGTIMPSKGRAFVYVYKDLSMSFNDGDTVILPNSWQPIKNAGNPFEFDYAKYASRNDLYYQQFLSANDVNSFRKGSDADKTLTEHVHSSSMDRLACYIHDKPTLGLIQSILIGDEANLDSDLRQAYSETGIIHIIAISGSHITIFFLLFAFLLSWIKNKKYHWLKYLLALPLIWFYVLMAEAPPSAVRAALMFTILSIGFAFRRDSNPLNYLFATAFLLLCAQPMWLFAIGFQLSFLAVLSLILFYKPIYNWINPAHFIGKGLWGAISASIAAEILVAPLVIYYFHLFPLLFILANVGAYLFMGIVLVLGILIVALSPIASIVKAIASVTVLLVTVFNRLVYWLQELNPTSFRYLDLKSYELIMVYLAIAAFAIFLIKQKKSGLLAGLTSVVILFCSLCYYDWAMLRQEKVVVYNISGSTHVELISGTRHTILSTDKSVTTYKKNYSIKPAHIGWHAWGKDESKPNPEIFKIGKHSVLVLNGRSYPDISFPIDYLIIKDAAAVKDIKTIRRFFHPQMIIVGNSAKRWQVEQWKKTGNKEGIAVHLTANDGAFILSAE